MKHIIDYTARIGLVALCVFAEASHGTDFFSATKDCSLGPPCSVSYNGSVNPGSSQFQLVNPQQIAWETLYQGGPTDGRRFTLNNGAITLSSDVTTSSAGTTVLQAGFYSIDINSFLMGPGTYTVTYNRASIVVSPTSYQYGSVKASTPSTHNFQLINNGDVDVTISGIAVSDSHFSVSGLAVGLTIPKTSNKSFQVTFSPGPVQGTPYNGMITISATSAAQPTSVTFGVNGTSAGDPHIATLDGAHYDLQSVGEFVLLRQTNDFEIQVRHTPVSTGGPITDPYDSLTNCVSINTAVAIRLGDDRVTIEPNLNGIPDPKGLQVRVNGVLIEIGSAGLSLESGGRLFRSSAGESYQLESPNGAFIIVTALFWNDTGKWYMNVEVFPAPVVQPLAQGIMAPLAANSWLPALSDGTSLGPMPASIHARYVQLDHTFADAWRVTDSTTLFDYALGTSTATFTLKNWPSEAGGPCTIEGSTNAPPIPKTAAEELCKDIVDDNLRANAITDVMITGDAGFAKLYRLTERNIISSTATLINEESQISFRGQLTSFTAVVIPRASTNVPQGKVQFVVDGKCRKTMKLDPSGSAYWKTSCLKGGRHYVIAKYFPTKGTFFTSCSAPCVHEVAKKHHKNERS